MKTIYLLSIFFQGLSSPVNLPQEYKTIFDCFAVGNTYMRAQNEIHKAEPRIPNVIKIACEEKVK